MSSTSTRGAKDENTLRKNLIIAEHDHFQIPDDKMDTTPRDLDPVFISDVEITLPYSKKSKDA